MLQVLFGDDPVPVPESRVKSPHDHRAEAYHEVVELKLVSDIFLLDHYLSYDFVEVIKEILEPSEIRINLSQDPLAECYLLDGLDEVVDACDFPRFALEVRL